MPRAPRPPAASATPNDSNVHAIATAPLSWADERQTLLGTVQDLTARIAALEQAASAPRSPLAPTSSIPPRRDVKTLVKTLSRFTGEPHREPSAKEWGAMVQATLKGCEDDEVLSLLPIKLEKAALKWYQLKVSVSQGPAWSTITQFLDDLQRSFPWTEHIDSILTKWDQLTQGKHESVISLAQRLQALALKRQLVDAEVPPLTQYITFKRALRPELRQALLNHFGPGKFRGNSIASAVDLLDEAIVYLTELEAITGTTPPKEPMKKLSNEASPKVDPTLFAERAQKGLCGKCGLEEWKPGHRCPKNPKTNTTPAKAAILDESSSAPSWDTLAKAVVNHLANAMFVTGSIGDTNLKTLVDSGSYFSYLNTSLVQHLSLHTELQKAKQVELGNGSKVSVTRRTPNVHFAIPTSLARVTRKVTFNLMDTGSVDVIIGRDLIKSFGLTTHPDGTITGKGKRLLHWPPPNSSNSPAVIPVRKLKRHLRRTSWNCEV